ncbi:MAG: DNA-binding protein [Kouleothrix sp.]|nr:DNA-binding protein [Kouleothrix sp.]
MPAQIVTQVMVNEAAETLASTGEEPTIRTVQARLGVGSYTTIKNYLEVWKQQQRAVPPAIVVPETIAAQGAEFTRSLWGAAAALAEAQTQRVRAEAQAAAGAAQAALADAEQTIARMEGDVEAQAQQLAEQAQALAQLRSELAQAHTETQAAEVRAAAGERQVGELRGELAEARAQALAYAEQAGELAALRRQVEQQATLIERMGRGAGG